MEIGSFIELQFPKGKEYYQQDNDIARLNSGRAAIWHALRVLQCDIIWLPYYQCDTVREFLKRKGIIIKYYHIDMQFNPIDLFPIDKEAVLIVNYFGIMSHDRMTFLAGTYKNVVIDNSQAFFAKPIRNCMNVYSCRKFIGVPDGAYIIGNDAHQYIEEYEQCYSSDTSLFMLLRIEYGCEGKAYQSRQVNEHRINTEDCMKMSILTRKILEGTEYENIKKKRRENFDIARELFDAINCLNVQIYYDSMNVPMVYPLVIESDDLINKLKKVKHFQGHWWSYLLDEIPEDKFEYWISRYIVPITIDQRYDKSQLYQLRGVIL